MAAASYLLDSNILIRWVQPIDPDYPMVHSALDALAGAGSTLCYTSQNLAEFWNACTRPADRNGDGLSPEEVDRRAPVFEAQLRLLPENLAVHAEWRRLLVAHRVSGVQVHAAPSGGHACSWRAAALDSQPKRLRTLQRHRCRHAA
jgi:hypothetical protein